VNVVIAWLMAFMTATAAPGRTQTKYPSAEETKEETITRYEAIADDIATVVWSQENGPLFTGAHGKAKTAAVMMGIMLKESGFRKDVDFGIGSQGVGDHGHSFCLMQVQPNWKDGKTAKWNKVQKRFAHWGDPPDQVVEGWTGRELVGDRKLCIEAAYRIMKTSFTACRRLPVEDWLTMYAAGNCESEDGKEKSGIRMREGINWFNKHVPNWTDDEAVGILPAPPPVTQASFPVDVLARE
jgi:hypothetical protein